MSGLIGKRELRNLRADVGTGPKTIVLRLYEFKPFAGVDVCSAGRHFANDAVENLVFPGCFHMSGCLGEGMRVNMDLKC